MSKAFGSASLASTTPSPQNRRKTKARNAHIIPFREPSECIAKADARARTASQTYYFMTEGFFYFLACAFEGNNVIVKYHLIHVRDCLFMWF